MDDFPWPAFVHGTASNDEVSCPWRLRLEERGVTGEAADVFVHCEECNTRRPMTAAFGDAEDDVPARQTCTGAEPHLRRRSSCDRSPRTVILGASNSWFSVTRSALSLPQHEDPLAEAVAQQWEAFSLVTGPDVLTAVRKLGSVHGVDAYSDEEILDAIAAHRTGPVEQEPEDLRIREWDLLTSDDPPSSADFLARRSPVPPTLADVVERVVLVNRLREVQALIGFTRITAPATDDREQGWTELARRHPAWLPASEVHGEGIFIVFREERLASWLDTVRDRREQRRYRRCAGFRFALELL